MKSTLSVAIATFNEQDNLEKCLDSVIDIATEIILVDGHSTDDTVNIAQKYPNLKIIKANNPPMFHINKQKAIDNCHSDWILQLHADEVATSELRTEIINLLNNDPKKVPENGFWINRRNFFLTKFLTKGGAYPDPTIRLYKNGTARLPCRSVHEQAQVIGQIGHLHCDLQHYADPTFSRYLSRNDRYTTLIADELLQSKVTPSFFNFLNFFILKPAYWFILTYFRHRGYIDGFPGFVFSWYSSLRFPIAYIKLYEKNNQKNSR